MAVTQAIGALLVVGAPVATARAADSSLGEMAANVNELVEPARRTELRLDAGAVTSFPMRGSRFDVALEIAPRPDYWYSVGVGSASGPTTTTVVMGGSDGNQVTTAVSTKDSDVSVSARIFKRIGPFVLSGGVLEDRPAVAVELRGWEDRVRFEIVDQAAGPWNVTGRPSIRVGGSLQLGWIYFQGGMQELLDGSLRAGYAGLGMRWKDGDLRDLLPWVAAGGRL
jgi:phospholipid/cholesterol/gamma-HCH transport system substrate-binding protein